MFLVVSDIEAARDDLLRRGVEVSEVFHFAKGPAPFGGVVGGPAPDHGSYGSYAAFNDPDGNGWLLQEVTTRSRAGGRRHDVRRRRATWRRRCGARRPRTASTRSAPASETRTGRPGTPRTWWRSRLARSCRCEVRCGFSALALLLRGGTSQ